MERAFKLRNCSEICRWRQRCRTTIQHCVRNSSGL